MLWGRNHISPPGCNSQDNRRGSQNVISIGGTLPGRLTASGKDGFQLKIFFENTENIVWAKCI